MPRKRKPKTTRRARGTGSIFPDKRRGGWAAKVPNGRKPDGKIRYAWLRAPTQEEVVRLVADRRPPAPGVTVAEWCRRWLASLDCREQSRENYEVNVRLRIAPQLGSLPVASVTPFHVEEAARLWGRSCGATTVRHTLATLAAALQAAMRADLIHKNPARLARKPRAAEQEFDLFTPGELLAVIEACVKDRRLYPIALCAAVGCRIGEALAASAGDIDARAGRLSIDKTVTRKRTVGPPKSRHGKRTVTVPRPARPALSQPPDTRSYRTILSRWELLLPALGIRYRGLHQLRHSVATYAIAAGVPVANVARDLGDSVQTVVKVYLHPVEGQGVGDAMEGLLGGAAAGRKRGAMKAKKGGKPGA